LSSVTNPELCHTPKQDHAHDNEWELPYPFDFFCAEEHVESKVKEAAKAKKMKEKKAREKDGRLLIDTTGDGKSDMALVDTTGDGVKDTARCSFCDGFVVCSRNGFGIHANCWLKVSIRLVCLSWGRELTR
jgi:hypothetical protein